MRLVSYAGFLFLCSSAFASNGFQPCRASIKHIENGGVGYDQGYSSLELFSGVDFGWCPFILFTDVRGHIFNDGKWAANSGIGVREKLGQRVWGINAYYDYRDSKRLHSSQVGIGLESLGEVVDIRVNGYLPVGKKTAGSYAFKFDSFSGNEMILSEKIPMTMKGGDLEVGFHAGRDDFWKVYGAAGPYYYKGPVGHNTWGGRARLSASYKHRITFELSDSYDHRFGNNLQGQVALTLPIGRPFSRPCRTCPSNTLACRLVQPVGRSEIIVMDGQKSTTVATNPQTGDPFYFIFVDNTSASNGTYESPYHSLASAQEGSSPYDILYVFPGDGTTTNMDEGIVLQANQKLWGAAIAHSLKAAQGTVTIPSMSVAAPQITSNSGVGITLNANNEVSGIDITDVEAGAIFGENVQNVTISYCNFSNIGGPDGDLPVYLGSGGDSLTATITNNTFVNNLGGAIFFNLDNGTPLAQITVSSNQITGTDATLGSRSGIAIDPRGVVESCQAVITGNVISDNSGINSISIYDLLGSGSGYFESFEAEIKDNICTNNTGGIIYQTDAGSCNMSIASNNVSGNEGSGFSFTSTSGGVDTATLVIENNQFNDAGSAGNGILFGDTFSNMTAIIRNNSLSSNSGSGFSMYNNTLPTSVNLTIKGNTVTGNQNSGSNGAGGITIDGFNGMVANISDNNLSDNVNGSAIGAFGSSVPNPTDDVFVSFNDNTLSDAFVFQFHGSSTACLTMRGNDSSVVNAYDLSNQNISGTFNLAPLDYSSVNNGDFSLTGVSIVSSCGD